MQGLEADEELEVGERDGDFGLVVGVGVFFWIGFVELFGEGFVRMNLERESFLEGEDLQLHKIVVNSSGLWDGGSIW